MLNREVKKVSVLTYTNTKDAYGQKRQGTPASRDTEMVLKIYSQSNVQDPRYVDIEKIGITKDFNISTANQIVDGTDKYNVCFTIPSGKYLQVLMKHV